MSNLNNITNTIKAPATALPQSFDSNIINDLLLEPSQLIKIERQEIVLEIGNKEWPEEISKEEHLTNTNKSLHEESKNSIQQITASNNNNISNPPNKERNNKMEESIYAEINSSLMPLSANNECLLSPFRVANQHQMVSLYMQVC